MSDILAVLYYPYRFHQVVVLIDPGLEQARIIDSGLSKYSVHTLKIIQQGSRDCIILRVVLDRG